MRKESETVSFQTLGRFETVGSNIRYGIPKGVATVRPHLRKVLKMTLYILRATVLKVSLFILKPSDKLLDGLREFIGFLGIE